MSRIDPEGQLTRAERLVVVIALAAALAVHLVVLFGWGRLTQWAEEAQKKERLVVIRRVRDIAPQPERPPEPARTRSAPSRPEGAAGARPAPPPEAQVKEEGPPPEEPELSSKMVDDLEQLPPEDQATAEAGENALSVVTDLREASFTVNGPASYRGGGTFWLRKGVPPGIYTATFHPVAGYGTPAIQTKELAPNGQIVFVGKYKKSVEVVVMASEAGASFTVYRPDGRELAVGPSGRAFLEDLPPGTYTAVFKDLAGHITPAPVTRTLGPGVGNLSFFGEYRHPEGGGAAGTSRGGPGAGRQGAGSGGGGRPRTPGTARSPAKEVSDGPSLDRRVQIVVKSYPVTDIEEDFDPIAYPEVIIRRSNFQRGWCQVYLIVAVDDRGRVSKVDVERPGPAGRAQYEALIEAVDRAVRDWDYDKVQAEVHVDARFYVE